MIISGGGTGGHIFPAIAIANAVKKKVPAAEILFVGAEGRMEMEKVPAAGYRIEGLEIAGFQRKLSLKNLSFPFKLLKSLIRARKILKEFKPDVVVGTGGYASGPMLQVAAAAKTPTLIQEQNSYAGVTNKILGRKVDKVCVAYEGMEKFFPGEKIILTGNPVRGDILQLEGKARRGFEMFGLNENVPTVLVVGGSLGARTINHSIRDGIAALKAAGVQLIWQTGKNFSNEAVETINVNDYKASWTGDFISKMDYAYAVADVVVSRAGAGSVSEIALVKKPCILVPSPNVAEDHQTRNAMALVNHQAAVLVKDNEAEEKLIPAILDLLVDQPRREKLSRNIEKLAFHNAADVIASEVIRLANSRKK